MWFKNLQIYRLPVPWAVDALALEEQLARLAFTPCSSSELEQSGWVSPREGGTLVHRTGRQLFLSWGTEKKLLPASVVKQVVKERCFDIAERDGSPPGRAQKKELKELVMAQLLPRAFSIRRQTSVWIDPQHGWLVIDTSSSSRAEEILTMLIKSIERLPVSRLRLAQSPTAAMTGWLSRREAPAGFSVDQDAELSSTRDTKASVRFVGHDLDAEDIQRHINGGKECTRLAMTWNSRISFILTGTLAIRRVKALAIDAESEDAPLLGNEADEAEARFNADMSIMTGELNRLFDDLVKALGGPLAPLAASLTAPEQSTV